MCRPHWVQTLPGVTMPGGEAGGEVSQWKPQGLFKEEGTQLRPGPVTRPSDPKDPPPPGAVRESPG